jgi:hypothetical protein
LLLCVLAAVEKILLLLCVLAAVEKKLIAAVEIIR